MKTVVIGTGGLFSSLDTHNIPQRTHSIVRPMIVVQADSILNPLLHRFFLSSPFACQHLISLVFEVRCRAFLHTYPHGRPNSRDRRIIDDRGD